MRNLYCPFYDKCLDETIKEDSRDFDCSKCIHRNEGELEETDFTNYWLLLWALFNQELYKKYRDAERRGFYY